MTSTEEIQSQPHLSKLTRIKLLWSAGVSLFWVVFMWRFWDRGFVVFGVNAFVYLAALSGLFLWMMHRKEVSIKENLFWIVPIGMIASSFLLYENPFLKIISCLLFPVLFACFYNYSFLQERARVFWSAGFIADLIGRGLSWLGSIGQSLSMYSGLFVSGKNKKNTALRIVLGVILFVAIASTIIIPLLSSADAVFAAQMHTILEWIRIILEASIVYKIIVGVVMSIGITAAAIAWSKPFTHTLETKEEKQVDPIISGIVLGGILGLYLLFLGIQLKQLWVGSLPFNFNEAVHLVKSGFWQLLFLTFINMVIYFFTYRKTIPVVQKILGAFMIASLLLLASAAHRMMLYVINYGFSYEKFFASYTVVFCAILLMWLISRLFINKRSDIVKFVMVLFLWMYGTLTIFPVEQFVLRANVALNERPESRIRLFELTMLSADVLGAVKKFQREGKLNQYSPNVAPGAAPVLDDWSWWIDYQEKSVASKKWYEKNLMNLISK